MKILALALLLIYVVGAAALMLQRPGLQYDEALLVMGAVHARHDRALPNYSHDEHTWICPRGRCIPLMTMRYVGAIKEWICWPLFALSDSRTIIIRGVSAAMGLIGILGVVVLMGTIAGWRPAAALAALWVVNPSYADMTVFDNGTVSPWMLAMGLLALAGAAHVRAPSLATAFAIGAAAGFGIWARANFLWLLIGVALVMAHVWRPPWRQLVAVALGGIAGGAPFLLYNVISRGGTLGAQQFSQAEGSWSFLLLVRSIMFSEAMLSNREHRAMWDAPALPLWQSWLAAAITCVALVICFARGRMLARAAALAFIATAFCFFTSKLGVAEHHLIALMPLAFICWVMAAQLVPRALALAVAAVYGSLALYHYGAAINGLQRTGGVGQWSDGILQVARDVDQNHRGRLLKIMDWGLENNLYVLLDGRLTWRNVYPDSTATLAQGRRPWAEEISEGGLYLLNGPQNRQFPLASEAFLKVLPATNHTRKAYKQRDGRVYAELIDIPPSPAPIRFTLDGVHAPEASGWRWTQRSFLIRWNRAATKVRVEINVPQAILDRLGPLQIEANGKTDRLAEAKQYVIERPVKSDQTELRFTLDKFLPPSAADQRELGVILMQADVAL